MFAGLYGDPQNIMAFLSWIRFFVPIRYGFSIAVAEEYNFKYKYSDDTNPSTITNQIKFPPTQIFGKNNSQSLYPKPEHAEFYAKLRENFMQEEQRKDFDKKYFWPYLGALTGLIIIYRIAATVFLALRSRTLY